MSTVIEICNAALLKHGAATIADFNEDSNNAVLCSALWPLTRDAVLRAHPWNCAILCVALSPATDAPPFGWSYSFPLPSDCLRVLTVTDADEKTIEHKVEGRAIRTDENPIYLKYVSRVEDVNLYDALLVSSMISCLSAELAYPITKSSTQQDMCWKLYIEKLKLAKAIDGQEDSPDTFGDFPLLKARG